MNEIIQLVLLICLGQTIAIDNCQRFIYGCDTCQDVKKGDFVYQSCGQCLSGMFLFQYQIQNGEGQGLNQKICVEDCSLFDERTINDYSRMECVYLGDHCDIKALVQSSVDQNYQTPTQQINQQFSHFESVDQAKQEAKKYFFPSESDDSSSIAQQETTAYSTVQCPEIQCKVCQQTNLQNCELCWGRFGDPNNYNLCYKQSSFCSIQAQNEPWGAGCYLAESNCYGCKICNMGFARDSLKRCYDCQQLDQNCLDCETDGCVGCTGTDNTVRCTLCKQGFGINAQFKCQKCQSDPLAVSCTFDSSGQEKILKCSNGYVLNSAGNKCLLHCPHGEYKQFYDENNYGPARIQCTNCDQNCHKCVNKDNNFCTSCKYDHYIKSKVFDQERGICEPKIDSTINKLQIFVIGLQNDQVFKDTQQNSVQSFQNEELVVSDLMSALRLTYEKTTNLKNQEVEILFETGTHVVNFNHLIQFQNSKTVLVDFRNTLIKLTMRPFRCQDKQISQDDPNSYRCQNYESNSDKSADQQKVRIVSKIGSLLQINVPLLLKIEDIHFDAIDSVQPQLSNSMKSSLEINCHRDQFDVNPTCIDDSIPLKFNQQTVCNHRHPASFFNFINIEKPIQQQNEIQTLQIYNCSFSNFLYEMGSFIRLPQRSDQTENKLQTMPFKLEVQKSTFQGFQICGSIISNDNPVFKNESEYMMFVSNAIQDKIEDYYTLESSQSVEALGVSKLYSIDFSENIVQFINSLKPSPNLLFNQKVPYQMQKNGLVVHLIRYPGFLQIQSNIFKNSKMLFDDMCSYQKYQQNEETHFYSTTITKWDDENIFNSITLANQKVGFSTQLDTFQLHSLIVIDQQGIKLSAIFYFNENQFINIIMSSSLVQLQVPTSADYGITFSKNQFENVMSHLSATVTITITSTGSGSQQDNILFERNIFKKVLSSCHQREASVLLIQRNNTDIIPSYQNSVRQTFPDFQGEVFGTVTLNHNQILQSSLSTNDNCALISVSNYKTTQMSNNTFDGIKSETFIDEMSFIGQIAQLTDDKPLLEDTQSRLIKFKTTDAISISDLKVNDLQINQNQIELIDVECTSLNINNFEAQNIQTGGVFILIGGKKQLLSASQLMIQNIKGSDIFIQDKINANNHVDLSECTFDGLNASHSIYIFNQIKEKVQDQKISIKISQTNFQNLKSQQIELINSLETVILEAEISQTDMNNIEARTIRIISNSNPTSSVSISQLKFDNINVLNEGIFFIQDGAIKQISITQLSLSNLKGGAQLFNVSQSFTQMTIESSKFQNLQGTSLSPNFKLIQGNSAKLVNCLIKGLSQYNFNLFQGKNIELDQVEIQNVMGIGDLINSNNQAESVTISNSVFKQISTINSVINGGINSLQISNVTFSSIRLATQNNYFILSSSQNHESINCTFSSISSANSFVFYKINLLKQNSNSQKQIQSFNQIVVQNSCVKEYNQENVVFECDDTDQKSLTFIELSHPQIETILLNQIQLSVTDSLIHTSGLLLAYSEPRSQVVNLPIQLQIQKLEAAICFLCGLDGLSLQQIDINNIILNQGTIEQAIDLSIDYQTQLNLIKLDGSNQQSKYIFKDITIDFGEQQFQYSSRIELLSPESITQSKSIINLFYIQNIQTQENELLLENISVGKLNTTKSSKLKSFCFIESDKQSFVTIKNITVSQIESQQSAVFFKTIIQQQSQQSHAKLVISDVKVDSVICFSTQKGCIFDINLQQQQLQISGSQFTNIHGFNATIFHSRQQSNSITITQTKFEKNIATYNNSFGFFQASEDSQVIVDSCSFKENTVQQGSTLVEIQNKIKYIIKQTLFIDNLAQMGTHGILLSPSFIGQSQSIQTPQLDIQGCTFEFSQQPDTKSTNIFGSHIQVRLIQGKSFGPKITISGSSFKMGSSQKGGALFYGFIEETSVQQDQITQSLSLQISDSQFSFNRVEKQGASIYLDNLDYYQINIQKVTFDKNQAVVKGDNLFVRQSQQSNYQQNIQNRRILSDTLDSAAAQQTRTMTITESQFKSNSPKTLVQIENLNQIQIQQSSFIDSQPSTSILDDAVISEGGALYIKNTYKINLESNTFQDLAAKIRGGAIIIKETNSTYFGKSLSNSEENIPRCVIDSNIFQRCSAIQGAVVFLDNVKSVNFAGSNAFQDNKAIKYDQIPIFATQDQTAEQISSSDQLGQGPVLFSECDPENQCSINIQEGAVFLRNIITDAATGQQIEDAKQSAIYAVGDKPEVADQVDISIEQYIPPVVKGQNFYLINNQDQIKELQQKLQVFGSAVSWIPETYFVIDNQPGSAFYDLFKLGNFTPSSMFQQGGDYIFGEDSLIVIVDQQDKLQSSDDQSFLVINCDQQSLNPQLKYDQTNIPKCLMENGTVLQKMDIKFNNGVAQVPKVYIFNYPNQTTYLSLKLVFVNTFPNEVKQQDIMFKISMMNCTNDQIINSTGLCQLCEGPQFYKQISGPDKDQEQIGSETCAQCPDSIFKCDGGLKVTTLKGFQRLSIDTDEYVQCPIQGYIQPCLEGDVCYDGHKGLFCSQCKPEYFSDSQGKCTKCPQSSNFARNFIVVVLYWVIFIIIAVGLTNILSADQFINKISVASYLLKSMINYIIYLYLVFEVFAWNWVQDDIESNNDGIKKIMKLIINLVQSLYGFPLIATVDMAQCQMFSQTQSNGMLTRKQSAYYSFWIFFSVVSLYILYKVFKMYLRQESDLAKQLDTSYIKPHQNQIEQLQIIEQDSPRSNNQKQINEKSQTSISAPRQIQQRYLNDSNDSPKNDLHRINPEGPDLKHSQNHQRQQIQSSLDKIGPNDNSISELVVQKPSSKSQNKMQKNEKAQILTKSYERLSALKARKLMLQSELQKFQDEIKSENQQVSSQIILDNHSALSLEQTSHQDQLESIQKFNIKQRQSINQKSGHEFTLANNEILNRVDFDNKRSQAYQSLQVLEKNSNSQSKPNQKTLKTFEFDNQKETINQIDKNSGSEQISQHQSPLNMKYKFEKQRHSQDAKNITPDFMITKLIREDEVQFSSSKPDKLVVFKNQPVLKSQLDSTQKDNLNDYLKEDLNVIKKQRNMLKNQDKQTKQNIQSKEQQIDSGTRMVDSAIQLEGGDQEYQNRNRKKLNKNQDIDLDQQIYYAYSNMRNDLDDNITKRNKQNYKQNIFRDDEANYSKTPRSRLQNQKEEYLQDGNRNQMEQKNMDIITENTQVEYQNADKAQNGEPAIEDFGVRREVMIQEDVIKANKDNWSDYNTLNNNQLNQDGFQQIDIKEISRNLQDQLFKVHKFEKTTIFIMIIHFCLNTQIVELLVAQQSCQQVSLQTFKGQLYGSNTNNQIFGTSVNFYDSSMTCEGSLFTTIFWVTVTHCLLWFFLLPLYVIKKSWRLYLIEVMGMIAKLLLVVISKVVAKINQSQSIFLCLLVVSIQLIIFVVLSKYQTSSQAEKIKKLNQLNFVDLILYIIIVVTCLLGIIDNLVSPEYSSIAKTSLIGAIIVINIGFILLWLFVCVQMILRYSKESPKLAILLLICSCGAINKKKDEKNNSFDEGHSESKQVEQPRSIKDLENQIKEHIKENMLAEQQKEKEIQRLDILIKHLENKQRQIINDKPPIKNQENQKSILGQIDDVSSLKNAQSNFSSKMQKQVDDQNNLIRELQELLDQNDNLQFDEVQGKHPQIKAQNIDIDTANNIDGLSYDSKLIEPNYGGIHHGLGTIGEEEIDDTRNWNKPINNNKPKPIYDYQQLPREKDSNKENDHKQLQQLEQDHDSPQSPSGSSFEKNLDSQEIKKNEGKPNTNKVSKQSDQISQKSLQKNLEGAVSDIIENLNSINFNKLEQTNKHLFNESNQPSYNQFQTKSGLESKKDSNKQLLEDRPKTANQDIGKRKLISNTSPVDFSSQNQDQLLKQNNDKSNQNLTEEKSETLSKLPNSLNQLDDILPVKHTLQFVEPFQEQIESQQVDMQNKSENNSNLNIITGQIQTQNILSRPKTSTVQNQNIFGQDKQTSSKFIDQSQNQDIQNPNIESNKFNKEIIVAESKSQLYKIQTVEQKIQQIHLGLQPDEENDDDNNIDRANSETNNYNQSLQLQDRQIRLKEAYNNLTQSEKLILNNKGDEKIEQIKPNKTNQLKLARPVQIAGSKKEIQTQIQWSQNAKVKAMETAKLYQQQNKLVNPQSIQSDTQERVKSQEKKTKITKELIQKRQIIKELTDRKKQLKQQQNKLFF